jgi:hypothetical protein
MKGRVDVRKEGSRERGIEGRQEGRKCGCKGRKEERREMLKED